LDENKNKIPTFWVEKKIIPKLCYCLWENYFFCLDPDPDWKKAPASRSVKNESGSETLNSVGTYGTSTFHNFCCLFFLSLVSTPRCLQEVQRQMKLQADYKGWYYRETAAEYVRMARTNSDNSTSGRGNNFRGDYKEM